MKEYKELSKKSGIYIIKNTLNNKVYVGSSKNLLTRIVAHKNALKNNRHYSKKLQNFYNKYGNIFYFEILEFCIISELFIREQYYIDTLKPWFNVALFAGAGVRGVPMSQKQKEIISNNTSKKILEFDINKKLINEWKSTLEASLFYECHTRSIGQVARGLTKQHNWKGKFFIYANLFNEKELEKRINESTSYKRTYKTKRARDLNKPVIVITPEGEKLEFQNPKNVILFFGEKSKCSIYHCIAGKMKGYNNHIIYLKKNKPYEPIRYNKNKNFYKNF